MIARFAPALAAVSPALHTALAPLLDHHAFAGWLSAPQVKELMQAGGLDEDALCFTLLPLAAAYAVTPLSHFNVGAIACGISGNLYFGANMEFLAAPLQQTVHAEQSAIAHAWLRGEKRLRALTVNYTPCGHCRQFMNELNSGTDLIICLPERSAATLASYLPDAFGPRDLAIQSLLLDEIDHAFAAAAWLDHDLSAPSPDDNDPLVSTALDAASRSHAPYSQSHSGVALQTQDGCVYAGRYAENAAFNPSLPPLQTALILMNAAGADDRQIRRAVLAERQNAPITQWPATNATLAALGCHEVHHLSLSL
ncbi:Cytidine deaminase [Sodalis glossinidius str. 'morsitans']|uniref:Cytidine deaminase n=2 Tax=Sodalis glossinidius (strain morsitans) TaxID=343509 RepID=CDD_SODGM|nr:cytidine deaminase [Sodalis glossinidius]Q2NUD2.1 RecName: Full=Cytidine deaminase; AltName: Full=Cytidine aminohydrolase; Short=CDA [Sodalis glossinidius str. 'morsitans']BAE74243.1 cytidine deaminase [Sodalis glossinidius str. 'morsitans']CRL44828.1 Cytidine deaminase [Sodalis glossinidius str. 'morsitans']